MQTTTQQITDKTINNINGLIQINLDSEQGFRDTADSLASDMYESLFREIADERRSQAERLKAVVKAEAHDATESGSILGKAHRWWAQLRDKLGSSPNYAVLAEAERGEDKILHLYQDMVDEVRGTVVYDLVSQQKAQVKRRHDQIRDLRDKAKEIEGKS